MSKGVSKQDITDSRCRSAQFSTKKASENGTYGKQGHEKWPINSNHQVPEMHNLVKWGTFSTCKLKYHGVFC